MCSLLSVVCMQYLSSLDPLSQSAVQQLEIPEELRISYQPGNVSFAELPVSEVRSRLRAWLQYRIHVIARQKISAQSRQQEDQNPTASQFRRTYSRTYCLKVAQPVSKLISSPCAHQQLATMYAACVWPQGALRRNRDSGHILWPVPDELNQFIADVFSGVLVDSKAMAAIKVLPSTPPSFHTKKPAPQLIQWQLTCTRLSTYGS